MKNKYSTLLLIFILNSIITPFANAQEKDDAKAENQSSIKWYTFEEAVKKNKKKPKKIFIDVYTDWCGWCKKMDNETFLDPTVVDYINKNYYPVKFNAEQKEVVNFKGQEFVSTDPSKPRAPHQLALVLLKQELRYPSYVLLDGENEWLYKIKGYKNAEDLLPILKYYGSDQYKVMSWTEYNESTKL
ncbi:MAG: thioredoxin family protein [Omnitrophica WOR_2 bacterium]|jgi:thioredoxin-related protein